MLGVIKNQPERGFPDHRVKELIHPLNSSARESGRQRIVFAEWRTRTLGVRGCYVQLGRRRSLIKEAAIKTKLVVAADSVGRVLAPALARDGDITTGIELRDERVVLEVEVPQQFAVLSHPAILVSLADARISSGGALTLKKIETQED